MAYKGVALNVDEDDDEGDKGEKEAHGHEGLVHLCVDEKEGS